MTAPHTQPCQFTQDLKDEVHQLSLKLVQVEMTQAELVRWQGQQNGTLGNIAKTLIAMDEKRESAQDQRMEDARLVSDKLDGIVDARRRDTDSIKDSVSALATLIAEKDAKLQKQLADKDADVQDQFSGVQKQFIALLVTIIGLLVPALVAIGVVLSNHALAP